MASTAGAVDWTLKSGTWRAGATADAEFRLVATAQGHAVAEGLPPQDLRAMFCRERHAALLPPEFRYSPGDGQALQSVAAGTAWVPPHGMPPVQVARAAAPFLGLRRCAPALRLAGLAQRSAQGDPDQRIPLPRPGRYEFFALRGATAAHLLLALDPDQGVPFVRLPCSGEWQALAGPEGAALAASGLPRPAWGCAVAAGDLGSRLLLPTEAGLARLTPDLPALRFELDYVSNLPALGAPLAFDDRVWLPLRHGVSGLRLLGVDARGELTAVDLAGKAAPDTGQVQAPVSTAHAVIWPCERGQLRLRRPAQPRGAFRADFLPWPAGVRPEFRFGCPFLGHEGDLWQLGFDEAAGQYLYLRLGDEHGSREPVDAPRSCSGSMTWRSAGRDRMLPWQQAEHVDDSRGTEAVLPLLEGADATVVALRLPAPHGLAQLFESRDKLTAQLVADDGHAEEHAFALLPLTEPWRLRLLVHDGHLWAYHPELRELRGWRLEP